MSESSQIPVYCEHCQTLIHVCQQEIDSGLKCPVCHLFFIPTSSPGMEGGPEDRLPDTDEGLALIDLDLDGWEAGIARQQIMADATIQSDELLKVEGLEDTQESFSVKCRICDSHILTTETLVGQTIQCPVCFSGVEVKALERDRQRATSSSRRPNFVQMRQESDRLSPDQRSSQAAAAEDESIELRLAGEPGAATSEASPNQSAGLPPSGHATSGGASPAANKIRELSRREKYELAQRREREKGQEKQKSIFAKPPSLKSKPATRSTAAPSSSSPHAGTPPSSPSGDGDAGSVGNARPLDRSSPPSSSNHPGEGRRQDLTMPLAGQLIVQLVSDTRIYLPMGVVIALLSCGNWLLHAFSPPPDADVVEWLQMMGVRSLAGGIPYLLGILGLWYLAGVVFRESAEGQFPVRDWRLGNSAQTLSTLGLFGFSFFVAGLPLAPLVPFWPTAFALLAPLRFFLSPLFLIAAWYNQHPLGIVAVDSLADVKSHWGGWVQLYAMVMGLSFIGFVGSSLLLPSPPWLYFSIVLVLSLPGTMLLSFATLSFAAICGWHAGNIARDNLK